MVERDHTPLLPALPASRPWHVAVGSAAAGLALATGPPSLPLVVAPVAFALLAACRAPALGALAAALVLAGAAVGSARLNTLDRPGRLVKDGRTVSLRVYVLTRPRPSPFGSSIEAKVAGGQLDGARLLVRVGGVCFSPPPPPPPPPPAPRAMARSTSPPTSSGAASRASSSSIGRV
jgi:hypothetical protein